jgi:hypothetical protein
MVCVDYIYKHIIPNFLYAHELQEMKEISVLHTKSYNNLVYIY